MNEKISLPDLSALLAEKATITKREAETFLREYFELMNEELIKSGSLKIKELGTFKLSSVEDRESIDVTTGERFLIPAHYKVAFSPDKKLAEIVNEPFAFFETTELGEEFEPGELAMLSEEETLKDSELIPEEPEETVSEKESVIEEEEEEPIFEEKPDIEEKKEKPVFEEEEPVFEEEEPVLEEEEPVLEKEEPVFEKEPIIGKKEKRPVSEKDLTFEKKYWTYKNKYLNAQEKLKRQKIAIFILSILLVGALAYIIYLFPFGKIVSFKETSPTPTVIISGSGTEKDTVSVISKTSNDSLVLVKKREKLKLSSAASVNSKQITVTAGQRLTAIALNEYGHKAFWIYIYLENKAILTNPNVLPVGVRISIPPAEKYGIDSKDSVSIQKAKEMAAKYS